MVFRAGSRLIAAQAHRGGAYREPDASRTGSIPWNAQERGWSLVYGRHPDPWHL